MWYFTADWHIGHNNIIKYCKRPFMNSVEQGLLELANMGTIPLKEVRISKESAIAMGNCIIDSTNAVVSQSDKLVILGDVCSRHYYEEIRNRINCKEIYLIFGNHDDRNNIPKNLFAGTYDQYTFSIDGQKIFCSHYPCRSWDESYQGAWSLYGHVHNLFYHEDNGQLMPYERNCLQKQFSEILSSKYSHLSDDVDSLVDDLLHACDSTKGIDYTLDVGIDNVREGLPFGTPWSMDDLREYMGKKKDKWTERKKSFEKLRT